MFEAAELGRKISKEDYEKALPRLRKKLLEAQFALTSADFPVIIIIEGVDNVSKGEVINTLNEWLDTRGLSVHAFGAKSDEEAERPRFWRYWRTLPSKGRIAVMTGAWYSGSLIQGVFGQIDDTSFDRHMKRIHLLENTLAMNGALILKYWLHISKSEQTKRFKKLEKHPVQRWQVSKHDKKLLESYSQYKKFAERAIRLTDYAITPWQIIEAENARYRHLTIAQHLLSSISQRLKSGPVQPLKALTQADIEPFLEAPDNVLTVLDGLDLSTDISKTTYQKELVKLQQKLNQLSWKAYHQKRSVVVVFEGWDAAGKGGAIRRITQAVDARISQVISIAAPTDEEKSHHYLWRFWRHIPRAGHVTIYDRSWYGRVLVERVEGFAKDFEWQRAYREINDFEEQLCEHGILVVKFWLHIDPDEQLRRFKEREHIPYKRHKITDEDWRNRDKWSAYEAAVNDMVIRTSTDYAPWNLVPANSKRYARLCVLKTLCEQLEASLTPPEDRKKSSNS
ncbi:MAG: polyphosphate:AMP phosphotransferase [Hahellaceae bacterium]|nr:polyphosphate:AMP phosphotransferase [Hahellaceae bacterium]MCP5168433.1 polyphosphate:AMP phosphotransferase [Hahellaceae bacterium]